MPHSKGRALRIASAVVLLIITPLLAAFIPASAAVGVLPVRSPAYYYNYAVFKPGELPSHDGVPPVIILPAEFSVADKPSSGFAGLTTSSGVEADVDPAVSRDPDYHSGIVIDAPTHVETSMLTMRKRIYSFTGPVPKSDEVDNSWFEDALFIGDSRTVGMMAYSGVKSTYYCKVALTIRGVTSNRFLEFPDDPGVLYTVLEAIAKNPVFRKVYINFGVNEASWGVTSFKNAYTYVINELQRMLPEAQIYIGAVLPVTSKVSAKNRNGLNNSNILRYNEMLQELAFEKRCFYLAINEPFQLEDGSLHDKGGDGIHLGGADVRQLFTYLRTHTVNPEVYDWAASEMEIRLWG